MPLQIETNEIEQEIFQRELESFVPDKLMDAHAHMWVKAPTEEVTSDDFRPWVGEDLTLENWRANMDVLAPGRTFGGIILALPYGVHGLPTTTPERVQEQAEHISEQVKTDPICKSTIFVSPAIDPDFVRQEVKRLNIGGLKCYQTESPRRKPGERNNSRVLDQVRESDIPEYLPEEFMRIANDLGLFVMLHMAKPRGIADPSNQYWVRTYCEKYPNVKLILAHAAASFNPVWAMEGIESLKGLPNVYCDTAAIGEVGAPEAIIQHLGHDRLLWATDFPISHWRGNYVAFGTGMEWIGDSSYSGAKKNLFVLHGIEQFRVIKQAAWHRNLNDSQVEDIFANNLANILNVEV